MVELAVNVFAIASTVILGEGYNVFEVAVLYCGVRTFDRPRAEMPRSKEGKTRPSVDPQALARAVEEVRAHGTSLREASQRNGVSRRTLKRHLDRTTLDDEFTYENNCNNRRIFTDKEEDDLVNYLVHCNFELSSSESEANFEEVAAELLSEQDEEAEALGTWDDENLGKNVGKWVMVRNKGLGRYGFSSSNTMATAGSERDSTAEMFSQLGTLLKTFNDLHVEKDQRGGNNLDIPRSMFLELDPWDPDEAGAISVSSYFRLFEDVAGTLDQQKRLRLLRSKMRGTAKQFMIDNMGSYVGENPYLHMKQAMVH
ncbi:hypothetical protein GE061_017303 [Apolygus lucorum]|uniref:HTH psq-type domain-containing protein n=1 Tax=Apolygus lucorum TaxID=248454 RepID=A0A8S9XCU0_APOLU|nr:hypothetical protein GE061_017303 [Apolygus lucorum]